MSSSIDKWLDMQEEKMDKINLDDIVYFDFSWVSNKSSEIDAEYKNDSADEEFDSLVKSIQDRNKERGMDKGIPKHLRNNDYTHLPNKDLGNKLTWESLIERERNKLIVTEEGKKETEGKTSYDEIDWDFINAMSDRMDNNKDKYPPKNWQKSMDEKKLAKAIIRHATKIIQDIDGDDETTEVHWASIGCNAMMGNYLTSNKND